MFSYKLTFIEDSEFEPMIAEFTEFDIDQFDISFNSKFSNQEFTVPFNQIEDKSLIKCQVTINFKVREESYKKLSDIFYKLNFNMNKISEVLIYRDDNLICDLNNIIDISSNSSLMDEARVSGFNLNITEGV